MNSTDFIITSLIRVWIDAETEKLHVVKCSYRLQQVQPRPTTMNQHKRLFTKLLVFLLKSKQTNAHTPTPLIQPVSQSVSEQIIIIILYL